MYVVILIVVKYFENTLQTKKIKLRRDQRTVVVFVVVDNLMLLFSFVVACEIVNCWLLNPIEYTLAECGRSERGLILEGRVCRYRDADADVDVDVAKVDVVVVVVSPSNKTGVW